MDGKFQILENHAPMVAALGNGTVQIITGAGEFSYWNPKDNVLQVSSEKGRQVQFEITTGFVEVLHNEISLLVQGYTAVD